MEEHIDHIPSPNFYPVKKNPEPPGFSRHCIESDILKLTELRAMAMHRKSTFTFPFFNEEFVDWIAMRVGEKRMNSLAGFFQADGFESRAKLRSHARVKNILMEDRARFLSMKK